MVFVFYKKKCWISKCNCLCWCHAAFSHVGCHSWKVGGEINGEAHDASVNATKSPLIVTLKKPYYLCNQITFVVKNLV